MTDKEYTLYEIDVQTPVSPNEPQDFTELLESSGYNVVTDLERGEIQLRDTAERYKDE